MCAANIDAATDLLLFAARETAAEAARINTAARWMLLWQQLLLLCFTPFTPTRDAFFFVQEIERFRPLAFLRCKYHVPHNWLADFKYIFLNLVVYLKVTLFHIEISYKTILWSLIQSIPQGCIAFTIFFVYIPVASTAHTFFCCCFRDIAKIFEFHRSFDIASRGRSR